MPADKKWFRTWQSRETLRDALKPFEESWLERMGELGREKKKEIEEYRRTRSEAG